ncbi:MAG: hypothetical protein MRK01_04945 [Candidatus Scalindua sp.]|nr:hypothetical protein [Candidatus Scalindua sp.]
MEILNQLFKNKYFLPSLQSATLFAFILLIYGAIGVTTHDKDFALVLRNTNVSNLIVWSYWWPLIILTAILLFLIIPTLFYSLFVILRRLSLNEVE